MIVSIRLHRFSRGICYLLKATKKDGHTSTGLLTARLEAWKLVPALFQVMFSLGHDGLILPNNHRLFNISRMFPGVSEPVLGDVSEVVLSTASSVLEYVWVLSCHTMLLKDAQVMYYLTSNMQYHQLRLGMLVRIVTSYVRDDDFTMPDWSHVLEGDKKHLARHIVDAKVEFGAELRTWDTELAESYWKDCLKLPHRMSSKTDSIKRMQMCLLMKDRLCIDELRQSISLDCDAGKRRQGKKTLVTIRVNNPQHCEFSIKTVYLQDSLTFSTRLQAWVRLDHATVFESRFLHCLTDMTIVSDELKEHFARYFFTY